MALTVLRTVSFSITFCFLTSVLTLSADDFNNEEPTISPHLYEWEDPAYIAQINDGGCPVESHNRRKRTAVFNDSNLWPNATIPYLFTDYVEKERFIREAIIESIDHLHERTCVKFIQYNNTEKDRAELEKSGRFVEFVGGNGCQSSVGRTAETGYQNVSIASICAFREMIIHELGHLVGLWHEHARYDRDSHVIVLRNNVGPNVMHNFEKQLSMRLLAPYDLSSIMHYNLKTFSGNDENVMKPILEDLQFVIGYRADLSFYDGQTVNKLYNCSGHCGESSPKCQNGGYLDKHCNCVCPKLLTGPTCSEIVTDSECGGIINVGRGKHAIKSPNYPRPYPESTDCAWLLKSPPGTGILLYIEDIDLERNEGGTCKDLLEVRYHYIGIDQGPMICGNLSHLKRKEYSSTTNKMILRFHSNAVQSGKGFSAVVKVFQQQNCASNPCLHGGKCQEVPEAENYVCICRSGWLGQNCEIEIVDGQWSEWSEWSGCAAQCGYEHRGRRCKKPINGGNDCVGPTGQNRRCSDEHRCRGNFYCDFGTKSAEDDCGIIQEDSLDQLDWTSKTGSTESRNTGPRTGHTTGDEDDAYYYIEASFGQRSHNATLWLPGDRWEIGRYCLQFHYHMYGKDMGQLRILRKTRRSTTTIWQESGCHGDRWQQANINIMLYDGVMIGFEGMKGDSYESDIAIDDISMSPGGCTEEMLNDGPSDMQPTNPITNGKRVVVTTPARHRRVHACIHNNRFHRVGKFSYYEGCKRFHCFCNQNGKVDCPSWSTDNICGDKNK